MTQVQYHVNPQTGEPSKCKAKISCPFGSEDEHFATLEAARKHFEKHQSSFTPMDHTPRANWQEIDERTANAAYSGYRAMYVKLRNPHTKKTSAERKQEALAAMSERYKLPISQLKSIVQLRQEQEGINLPWQDPQHQELMAWREGIQKLWLAAEFDEHGQVKCHHCESTKDVFIRVHPFEAEINDKYIPTLNCGECDGLIADEI